jgi:4-diphosphocytidyl-2-C-methyl-D-erythritol kinase
MALAAIETARAKVNLALHVLGRRPDGYHELDSIVAFADFGDVLHFEASARWELSASGPFATGLPDPENNIVAAACRAAAAIAGELGRPLPPMRIGLEKNLPVAAGLGGGSADAAAALRGLLAIAGIDPGHPRAAAAAFALGADVPVCLKQQACRMRGAGETILPARLGPFAAVLISPMLPLSTAAVFAGLGLEPGQTHSTPIADPADWRTWRNDLTASALTLVPAIAAVIAALEASDGLLCARMSGSGATCFGLFEDERAARRAAASVAADYPHWWVKQVTLG